MSRGCFGGTNVRDVTPRPLDPTDIYQQFKLLQLKDWGFSAKSIASDGFPPKLLRHKYWSVQMATPRNYRLLDEARGLDSRLRDTLPPLGSRAVVGKWYCPFMFVTEEGMKLKEQMKKSMFYEMTLEQRWDKIFECENACGGNERAAVVVVDVSVAAKAVQVAGRRGVSDQLGGERDVMYFKSSSRSDQQHGRERDETMLRVGLRKEVVERIKWEQHRVGWVNGDSQGKVRVERAEEFIDGMIWSKFGCYVLVESFVLKRTDSVSTLVLTFDFNHTHQIRCKWD